MPTIDNTSNPLYNAILDQFPQGEPRTIEEARFAVNPDYNPRKEAYSSNCARVVQNAELQMRGIFTEANAFVNDNSQNYLTYINKVWKTLEGNSPVQSQTFRATANIKDILSKDILAKTEEGARGFLRMGWKGQGSRHVINWIVEDGEVKFVDFQTHTIWNETENSWRRISAPQWTRIDNCRPTEVILNYIKGAVK